MSGSPQIKVFVDADNTLWDTDRVFASAQLDMLKAVEVIVDRQAHVQDRLAFVRTLDQMLAERHHARLRYPPRLLARALAFALNGTPPKQAVRFAWKHAADQHPLTDSQAETVEAAFMSNLSGLPQLRPGVVQGLAALHAANCLVIVVTEGRREKVAQTASAHHLNRYIDRIIEAPKHKRLYERVKLLSEPSSREYMVGDQLERDIRPAKEARLTTIYFPSGFKPRWESDIELVNPDYTISTFADVPSIVLSPGPSAKESKIVTLS